MTLNDWVNLNLGQIRLNPSPPHGINGQCVNLASSWSLAQGGPELFPGDTAYSIFQIFRSSFFDVIQPGGHLSPGDIVFFLPNNAGTGTGYAGHVNVAVDNISPNGFRGLDADWNASPQTQFVNHTFNGVAGWFHPKGDDMLTKEQIEVIYILTFEVEDSQVPQDIINAYVGKPLDGLLTHLHQDPTWLAHKASATPGDGAVLAPGKYIVK